MTHKQTSRDIKFRAWDGKAFRTSFLIHNETGLVFLTNYGTGFQEPKPDWIVEQHTGLKDKNDNDIYEGDIIAHYADDVGGEVVFWEGAFIAGAAISGNALVNYATTISIEVIGNIHETPELLHNSEGI